MGWNWCISTIFGDTIPDLDGKAGIVLQEGGIPVNPKNWEKHIMIQNGILSISLRFSFKMGKQDMSI